MKTLFVATLFAVGVMAQSQTPGAATMHAPDGGTSTRLQSVTILPLVNAPFSAVVNTEWTTILADGTRATIKNHRTVARDSSGRVFEERRSFSPNGDKEITQLRSLEFRDPTRHEFYNCIVAQRTCYLSTDMRLALQKMPEGSSGLQVCGCATRHVPGVTVQLDALGQKTLGDVEVTGSREITTLPAAQLGSERPQPIVKEFWYSPRLGVNLIVNRFDPRSGVENFVVDNLSLNEPDTSMFNPPADYQVVSQVVVKQRSQTQQ
jgi:hypothetical protein